MQKNILESPLCPEEKHLIVILKQYFDRNKKAFTISDPSSKASLFVK